MFFFLKTKRRIKAVFKSKNFPGDPAFIAIVHRYVVREREILNATLTWFSSEVPKLPQLFVCPVCFYLFVYIRVKVLKSAKFAGGTCL